MQQFLRRLIPRTPRSPALEATGNPFLAASTTQPEPVADHAERGLREINSVAELDKMLREVDAALAISDDAMRAKLNSFKFVLPDTATAPTDLFSAEYADFQMALYELICGRRYQLQNERSDWIIPEHKVVPFPFYTGSWQRFPTNSSWWV